MLPRELYAIVRYVVGGIDQVDVACRELLLVASSTRQKYNLYLEESKKKLKQNNQTKRGRLCLTTSRNCKRRKRGCSKISGARFTKVPKSNLGKFDLGKILETVLIYKLF